MFFAKSSSSPKPKVESPYEKKLRRAKEVAKAKAWRDERRIRASLGSSYQSPSKVTSTPKKVVHHHARSTILSSNVSSPEKDSGSDFGTFFNVHGSLSSLMESDSIFHSHSKRHTPIVTASTKTFQDFVQEIETTIDEYNRLISVHKIALLIMGSFIENGHSNTFIVDSFRSQEFNKHFSSSDIEYNNNMMRDSNKVLAVHGIEVESISGLGHANSFSLHSSGYEIKMMRENGTARRW